MSAEVAAPASWSIFDGRATKAAQISARANIKYYERYLQTQTDTVLDQVRSMEKQLGFSHRAMLLSESRNVQAESAARQRQDEAKQGLASQVTVDIALSAQDTYRLYLLNQRADFLSRWSEFVSVVDVDPVLQLLPKNISSNAR